MKFFNKLKKYKVLNEDWVYYHSFDIDELVQFVSVDLTYENVEQRKSFVGEVLIKINIPLIKLNNGIPIDDELDFQNQKEEELLELLVKSRIDCFQVGRITTDGKRLYLFEYNDIQGLSSAFDSWKKTFNQEYKIEFNAFKAFENYEEILPNVYNYQQIGNRAVIEELFALKTDESKVHYIEHAIFGEKENLTLLFEEIKGFDFTLISQSEDLLEVGFYSLIDIDLITNQTDYLLDVSEKYNCTYDGWCSAVIRKE